MRFSIIFAIFLSALSIIFVAQNSESAEISFLAWSFDWPIAFSLLVTLLIGFLIGVLFLIPTIYRSAQKANKLGKENVLMKKSLENNPQNVVKGGINNDSVEYN